MDNHDSRITAIVQHNLAPQKTLRLSDESIMGLAKYAPKNRFTAFVDAASLSDDKLKTLRTTPGVTRAEFNEAFPPAISAAKGPPPSPWEQTVSTADLVAAAHDLSKPPPPPPPSQLGSIPIISSSCFKGLVCKLCGSSDENERKIFGHLAKNLEERAKTESEVLQGLSLDEFLGEVETFIVGKRGGEKIKKNVRARAQCLFVNLVDKQDPSLFWHNKMEYGNFMHLFLDVEEQVAERQAGAARSGATQEK